MPKSATKEFVEKAKDTCAILKADMGQIGSQDGIVFDHDSKRDLSRLLVETLAAAVAIPEA